MDIKKIKRFIYDNDKVEFVLEQIGCKNIKKHDNYYSCGNFNGDNPNAICQYFDSEYLNCINYTRDISYNNSNYQTSLIDLVCYNKEFNLFEAVKYLCDILNLDYYAAQNEDDIPESLKILQMLYDMKSGDYIEDNVKLKPINEYILNYYKPYANKMFFCDGINIESQIEFEFGYDDSTNNITIPIRDELGNLVGVKGRVFDNTITEGKYIYLEKCARSKILYNLHRALPYIKRLGKVIVVESEKACAQLHSMGVFNCVSTGGKKITKTQKNKLASLGVDILFAFDKDVEKDEVVKIASYFDHVGTYMILDDENILEEKESPTDDKEKWGLLYETKVIKI